MPIAQNHRLAGFQRESHQPPGQDCHGKSRTAIGRVQYPKGIAPWVACRKGHCKDLPWPTNGGMPLRGIPPYDLNDMARKANALCTAICRVQYPKGIAPWVAYRRGHCKDLLSPTNGGMPLRGIPPYDLNG